KYKYDSSQQYVYGTLKTQLQDGETIQIAVKDSTVWYNVTEVSDYLFSYKLPIYFLSGNIYVRSIIGGAITNRFGNNLATSTYYVDWVGTNLRLNPNLTFNTIYRGSNAIFFQRNNTNTPFTILNPILANTTDAIQKTQAYSIDPYLYYYSTLLPAGRPKTNNSLYLDGLFTIYSYYPQGDTSIARYYGTNVLVPARNKDVSLVNTDGNTIIKIDNKAPSGVYNFAIQLNNSLNEPNFVEVRPDGTLRTIFVIQAILADSLKAVQYTTNKYVNTALKAVKSGSPVIIGNDGSVQAIRYQILARRNGVDITNQYSIDAANFSVSTTNRPIGTDSVFLTYTGWFNEVVKDTLIFGFVYTKPSIEFSPNESNDFSLINASASFTPLVLDSGGKTLTYILLDPNANFTFNNQTGKISLVNWEALTAGYTTTLRIEASNGTYKDTATFTYTKNAQNKVLYYSNSSYRTKSTNGEDYIQLPGIDLRNKAFGMDIWYKLNAQTGSWHRIMDIGTGGNNQGVLIAFPDTMQLFVRTPNQSDNTITIPAWVNIRNWNHYLISVSSAGVASFYINGRLIFNRTGGGTTPQTIFTSNYLGKSNYGGADAPSNGQFTDFRIWDNAIDSTVYNTRGINRITANTGANLIFYLPLSLPVFNRDLQLTDNYPLVNKAAIASTAILDSVSYIKGNSNSFNFDADRIFIAGQSSINNATKSVTLTSKNYASVADTNTKTPVSTLATANKYYWWGILPASQGTYLNNQIIGVNDYLNAGTSVNYNSIVTYLPRFPTYIPGDSIQVFTSKAGYVLPRNDYWVSTQKPIKYTLIDSGGLGNIIQVQLDTVTGRFSWLATEPNEAIYPIKISVTNEVGTININSKVLLSDSIQSIQYPVDSISVNYGNDSSSIPYTA
ncbi:MAG: LamG domain-containing protein, partial [Sediminibacterium sp.]|nr:LamG domain-containing protein [Sediminibacterium sp.]